MNAFIRSIRDAAQGIPGIHAGVVAAQAALESNFGKSGLVKAANNLFGIKTGSSWQGDFIELPTQEFENGEFVTVVAKWRKYASFRDSILDYASLIQRVYPHVAAVADDGEAYAKALVGGMPKYATDPAYAQKLINIATEYNLLEPENLLRIYRDGVEVFRMAVPDDAQIVTNTSPGGKRFHLDVKSKV